MAISQMVGRKSIEDTEQYRISVSPATEMYLRFREDVGHTLCAEIQKIIFGRAFRLYDPEEQKAFEAAGGHKPEGCPNVCRKAATIAARIILDLRNS